MPKTNPEQKELEAFNGELKALLEKYDLALAAVPQIRNGLVLASVHVVRPPDETVDDAGKKIAEA